MMRGSVVGQWSWTENLEAHLPRGGWTFLFVIAVSALIATQDVARPQSADPDTKLQFDMPSQPLASALISFRATTRLELFYESTLIDHHRSPSIHGVFSPDVALRLLLEGTGLSVASFEPGTMTILPPSPQPGRGTELAKIKDKAAEFTSYLALIQAAIHAAFCRSPETQTDTSELFIRLWIAPSGALARAELLSPPGSDGRDQAYAAAIRSLVLAEPPPERMPQPVTLMVLPRGSRASADCVEGGASRVVEHPR